MVKRLGFFSLFQAANHFLSKKSLFLADGDALIMPHKRLVAILKKIRGKLPTVKRIRLYANAKSILAKTPDQLNELKALGLDRVYMGLESGHDQTLAAIGKWGNRHKMIAAAEAIHQTGLFLSVTVLLGIGGTANSTIHARETATALNSMAPNQIAALTLMIIPGTPLYDQALGGNFVLPDANGLLKELRHLVAAIDLPKVIFQANHASNYLPIDCRLQRDKERVLTEIDSALAGTRPLMPEYMRGL